MKRILSGAHKSFLSVYANAVKGLGQGLNIPLPLFNQV